MSNERLNAALKSLMDRISLQGATHQTHPQQAMMPEWSGAGVAVRSPANAAAPSRKGDFSEEITVRTIHARPLTWLLLELRDSFGDDLDFSNKHEFYEMLAAAAQRHLRANPWEPSDPRPLLSAVMAQAIHWLCQETQPCGLLVETPHLVELRGFHGEN